MKGFQEDLYCKYGAELYGVLSSLTVGAAKSIFKGLVDRGDGLDRFKALVISQKWFDTKASASLLQTYLDVVTPPGLKGAQQVVQGFTVGRLG